MDRKESPEMVVCPKPCEMEKFCDHKEPHKHNKQCEVPDCPTCVPVSPTPSELLLTKEQVRVWDIELPSFFKDDVIDPYFELETYGLEVAKAQHTKDDAHYQPEIERLQARIEESELWVHDYALQIRDLEEKETSILADERKRIGDFISKQGLTPKEVSDCVTKSGQGWAETTGQIIGEYISQATLTKIVESLK
jgi:hypothetical protein